MSAVLDQARVLDPEGWHAFEQILHVVPAWVGEIDRTADVPAQVWDELPTAVLSRMGLPPARGGSPLLETSVRRSAVWELVGRVCPGFVLALPGPALSGPAMARIGTEAQQREYFATYLGDRPRWSAFAITEASGGTNVTAMATTARQDGDSYVLNGAKRFIGGGDRAQTILLFATVDPARGPFGIRAFLIDAGTEGFVVERVEDMMGMRAARLTALRLTDCRVPADRMLGWGARGASRANGFVAANASWAYMRPGVAALMNGACAEVLDRARPWITGADSELTRPARRDAEDELEQWRARVETSRLLAQRAAWLYDRGESGGCEASVAKCFASTTAVGLSAWLARVAPVATATGGNPLEKFCRDARAFDILEGTGDAQRLIISRTFSPAGGHQRKEVVV